MDSNSRNILNKRGVKKHSSKSEVSFVSWPIVINEPNVHVHRKEFSVYLFKKEISRAAVNSLNDYIDFESSDLFKRFYLVDRPMFTKRSAAFFTNFCLKKINENNYDLIKDKIREDGSFLYDCLNEIIDNNSFSDYQVGQLIIFAKLLNFHIYRDFYYNKGNSERFFGLLKNFKYDLKYNRSDMSVYNNDFLNKCCVFY